MWDEGTIGTTYHLLAMPSAERLVSSALLPSPGL